MVRRADPHGTASLDDPVHQVSSAIQNLLGADGVVKLLVRAVNGLVGEGVPELTFKSRKRAGQRLLEFLTVDAVTHHLGSIAFAVGETGIDKPIVGKLDG